MQRTRIKVEGDAFFPGKKGVHVGGRGTKSPHGTV